MDAPSRLTRCADLSPAMHVFVSLNDTIVTWWGAPSLAAFSIMFSDGRLPPQPPQLPACGWLMLPTHGHGGARARGHGGHGDGFGWGGVSGPLRHQERKDRDRWKERGTAEGLERERERGDQHRHGFGWLCSWTCMQKRLVPLA